jgi:hypothetical protein
MCHRWAPLQAIKVGPHLATQVILGVHLQAIQEAHHQVILYKVSDSVV